MTNQIINVLSKDTLANQALNLQAVEKETKETCQNWKSYKQEVMSFLISQMH